MMPDFDLTVWGAALGGSLMGLGKFLSGRKETEEENADTIECHTYVLDHLLDADSRSTGQVRTGVDYGDQLSVEEVEAIQSDLERRRVWPKNN